MTCSHCPHCLAEIARLDGELAKARVGLTPIAEAPQHIIEIAIAIGERDDARQALDAATGPHCSSCGNSIDPEACWCGDGPPSKHVDETHGFIPMGCDCSRAFEDRDWMKCASELRSRLWQASKERDEARAEVSRLKADLTDTSDYLGLAKEARDRNADELTRLKAGLVEMREWCTGEHSSEPVSPRWLRNSIHALIGDAP